MDQILTQLETANAWLVENFGEFGPLLVVGILGLFLILLTLPILLRKQADPLDKLRQAAQTSADEKNDPKKAALRTTTNNDKLEKYSTFLEPQDEEEYSAMALKLLQAGYRSKMRFAHSTFCSSPLVLAGWQLVRLTHSSKSRRLNRQLKPSLCQF